MKRPNTNRRAVAIAIAAPVEGSLWLQLLAAAAIVASYLAAASALR